MKKQTIKIKYVGFFDDFRYENFYIHKFGFDGHLAELR